MSYDAREQKLADFVAWTSQYIKGDEKGEAQIFLEHLFRAFGQRSDRKGGPVLGQWKVRAKALQHTEEDFRALNRNLELPGQSPLKDAHADLDQAVLGAYGFAPTKTSSPNSSPSTTKSPRRRQREKKSPHRASPQSTPPKVVIN